MRVVMLFFVCVTMVSQVVVGQVTSCLDPFQDFDALEPEVSSDTSDQTYQATMVWYGECILIGSDAGLWLYDPEHPNAVVQLAAVEDSAIVHVAVNPANQQIAFNIAHQPIVYLINPASTVESITAEAQVVTSVAFSENGNSLAVASSETFEYEGAEFYDAGRVQVWNIAENLVSTILSDSAIITYIYLASDGDYVLTHRVDPGYIGDNITYWQIEDASSVWSYSDLLRSLDTWSVNDPLAVLLVEANNGVLALGGLDGYHDWDDYYGTGVHLWDMDSLTRIQEIVIHRRGGNQDDQHLTQLALNTEGTILATIQNNGVIRTWDTRDGVVMGEFSSEFTGTVQLQFSPEGGKLAVLNNEEALVLNVHSMEEIASFNLSAFPSLE